ncbi:MAG: Hsp20/alpha crystallin family protein [Dehalococcoidia bacterium]
MMLRRWEPFRELWRMREEREHWPRFYFGNGGGEEVEGWAVPLDVVEEADNIVVHATMPGVKPEDIEVTVEENELTIKGKSEMEEEHKEGEYLMRERRTGAFHRILRLPGTVDTEKAMPTYENGVLTVTFPKVEAKKAKHLKVAVGKALENGKK